MSNSFDTRPLIPSQTNNEGDSVSLSISASDSTSGTLKYAAYGLPAGLVINPSTGAVTGTVAAGDAANGPYTVTVGANDSTYNAPTTFTWNVNSPISITPPAGQTDDVGSSVSVTILASDSRSGTTLTYTATGLPPGVYLNPGSGVISGTVGIGGSWQSTITVSDGTYSANVPLNWSVSSPIVITDPGALANSVGDSVSQQITATDTASGTLSYTATGLPPGLSISSSTGLISGTVGSSASTTTPYTPTVTVSDGTHTAIDTFTWSISPAGPIVVTNPGSQTNTAGDQVVLQLQATDTNGQTLLYSATGLPAGLYINPTTGEIFGTVSSSAVSTVTVEAADGSHDATQAFTWTVNAAGHVTMTNPGDQASAEGASVSLSISASDSSGTLRYVAFNLPPGLEISTSTGAISGTVGAGDAANGPYTVTVVAGDGTYWASQTFNWTVNNPVTISAPADQTNNEGDTVSLSISASDSTSGTLSYAALGLPPGLKINASTGAITGTVGVGATAAGPYGVTIVAGDGTYSSTQTFNWTVNSPITITPPATQTNNEGDSVSLSVSASDSRSGTTLTYSALGLPPGLAINASTGAISGTVALGDAAVGSYFPTIIVGDGTYYNSQNVEWDVNSPVSITDPGAEANVVGDVVSLQVTAVDASSGTMTYAATGLPAGLSISTSTGLVSGTISSSATDIGFYATTVTVGDGTYVQTDTFGWAVAAAGTVTMTTPSNQSSTEGNSASLSISASDSGSGTLKYIAESLPGGLKINPSTGAITGTLALADAANGPYTVTVIATDGTNSAQETFTWTVSSPVTISTVSAQTNTEGNTVSLSISASDSSSGTLQYSAVGLPAGLAINTGTGAITGTVALGDAANGSYTVTVTAGDGTYSTNLTFTWTVSSPVTVTLPAGQTNAESDTPSLSIGASDSSSGTLLYSAVGLPAGLKINTSTGAITGTVALGTAATGQYSVTVTASDGTYTASQTFDWGINSPVTITPLPLENFSEGNTVSVQVQASDSSSGTLTYVATGLPSGLSINSATGLISGTISSIVAGAGNFLSTIGVMDGTYSSNVTLSYSITAPLLGLASGAVPAQTLADRPSKVSGIGTGLGIAILGPDGKVQYYPDGNPSEKPQPLTPPTTRPEGVTATSVVASPDGSWIFVGLSNGQIEYYKPSDGSYQGTLKLANTPQDGIVAMIPTGQANTLIIVDGKGTVWIYNTVAATITNPGKLSLPVPPKGQSVVWGTTPYGVVMVVGNEMRVYDPKTGKVYTYTITNLPKGAVVTSVVWITIGGKQKLLIGYSLLPGGPSGSLSYGEGDLIEIIRGNKPNPSTSYPAGQGEKNNLTSVFNLVPAKGPDAGKLIQASNTAKGGTIDVLGGGAALKDANNLPQIASMTTTPDGEYLIVAFADGTVGVWKLKDGTKVYPIKKN